MQFKRLFSIKAASAAVIVAALTAIVSNVVQYRCAVMQTEQSRVAHNVYTIYSMESYYDNNLLKSRNKIGRNYIKGTKADFTCQSALKIDPP